MTENTSKSKEKLENRLEVAEHMAKVTQSQFNDLAEVTRSLRDANDKLKNERDGWKRATARNGVSGFILGAMIFIWIGYAIGFFTAQ